MCYNVRSKYFYNEDLGQLTPVKTIYNEICKQFELNHELGQEEMNEIQVK